MRQACDQGGRVGQMPSEVAIRARKRLKSARGGRIGLILRIEPADSYFRPSFSYFSDFGRARHQLSDGPGCSELVVNGSFLKLGAAAVQEGLYFGCFRLDLGVSGQYIRGTYRQAVSFT
jgi:hypothetical protein